MDLPSLLTAARNGDPAALDRLLRDYRGYVQRVIVSRDRGQMHARIDASDIVQETLLQAAQHIRDFAGQDEVAWRAWLKRIAERELIRQLRVHLGAARRALDQERALDPGGTSAAGLQQWLADSVTSPSGALARQENLQWLMGALAQLHGDYREILLLRHFEGLGFPEIAARLDRQEGAARVLWVRALKKLKEAAASRLSVDG